MVGQQVQLEASPSSVAGVQWSFDSTNTSSVVGNYTLNSNNLSSLPSAVPAASVSPVPSSGSAISLYWISNAGTITTGVRYVRMTGTVSGITGPLFADVYYPVDAPAPWATAIAGTVGLPTNYPANGNPEECASPNTAIAVGNLCPTVEPGTVGIYWAYLVATPSPGPSGLIAMVQIANSLSISASGTPSPNPKSYTSGPGLDAVFPYASPAPAATQWNSYDAPALILATPPKCQTVTDTMSFTDYFMYQPGPISSRVGYQLWVTLGTMAWNWSGTASSVKKAPYALVTSKSVNPQPSYAPSTTLPTWTKLLGTGDISC